MEKMSETTSKEFANALLDSQLIFCEIGKEKGFLCNAANETLVQALQVVLRPKFTYVLVDSTSKLQAYVSAIPEIAYDLFDMAEEGILIVFKELTNMASTLLDNSESVAVGIPTDTFIQKIVQMTRKPVAFFPLLENIAARKEEIQQTFTCFDGILPPKQKINAPYGIIKLEKDGTFVLLRE
ncbi:MAG: Sua5/YciO/YrdC/YwlC family protein [Paludibacteraceae bacterium]|nr:Sua5/YciO/YrdC/YwlC family protein [Paludibacteraceae bacterium]